MTELRLIENGKTVGRWSVIAPVRSLRSLVSHLYNLTRDERGLEEARLEFLRVKGVGEWEARFRTESCREVSSIRITTTTVHQARCICVM